MTVQQLIRDHEVGLVGVITVLQRSRHELDLILVPCDLRQEPSGRANHNNIDYTELLNRGMRQAGHILHGLFGVALIVEPEKVVQVLYLMA